MTNTTDSIQSTHPAPSLISTGPGDDGQGSTGPEGAQGFRLKYLYEQSTQFNHWRYTQEGLGDLRGKVNRETIATIKDNIQEERRLRAEKGLSMDNLAEDAEFLTVKEELALLGFYERKMGMIFRYWKLPSYVLATAIVYMKRFYLQNSVMDYHPKEIMVTCMFLARKTENFLMTIEDFTSVLKSGAESILELEFLVCKNLRFHFTVHHPYRSCLGIFYDMQAVTENMDRLQKVYETALKIIDTSLHTDLCFLYQPSQIAMAAMRIASKQEAYDFERYATYKFKADEASAEKYTEALLPILLAIARILSEDPRCREVGKAEAAAVDKKIKSCKDPAKSPDCALYAARRAEQQGDDDDDDDDREDDRAIKRSKMDEDAFD